jgi:hypothetical protein
MHFLPEKAESPIDTTVVGTVTAVRPLSNMVKKHRRRIKIQNQKRDDGGYSLMNAHTPIDETDLIRTNIHKRLINSSIVV